MRAPRPTHIHRDASTPDAPARRRARIGALLLFVACLSGSCHDTPAEPLLPDSAQSFDRFWAQFDSTYPFFRYKRVDWSTARARFAPEARSTTDMAALVQVLTRMVAPMRDGHIWFTAPSGTVTPTYVSDRPGNWEFETWREYVARLGWVQLTFDIGYGRSGDVGYIAIGSWNPTRFTLAHVDSALDHMRDSRALILDVRPNGGGDELLALDAAARFVTAERVVTYSRWRVGPHHDDLSSPRARTVAPRGPWTFTKPVVLLVGAASASANESFIAALAGLPNVDVLGDTTAGSSASPREFFLGGGWRFTVPQTITYTADMAEIEWRGIAPDVYVPVPHGSWEARVDPVLEAALARTRASENSATSRRLVVSEDRTFPRLHPGMAPGRTHQSAYGTGVPLGSASQDARRTARAYMPGVMPSTHLNMRVR